MWANTYINTFLKINHPRKFIIFMTSQTETFTKNTKVYQLIQYFFLEIICLSSDHCLSKYISVYLNENNPEYL